MARSFDERLARLRSRRTDPNNDLWAPRGYTESYEKRAANKATRYALGAMQEVNSRSTQISLEEAEKVQRNLSEGLKDVQLSPYFRLQGSVPLNVHIRGASDVDLLVIDDTYLTFTRCEGSKKSYLPYTGRGSIKDDVLYLRKWSEEVLERRFWGAKIDKSPAKSIQLSEGAFRRKVDVVPANWYDTAEYQKTLDESFRGVQVVDKYTGEHIENYPFLYIQRIKDKAAQTNEGARMGIRLVKNVKNDDETEIALSSYDIGSLLYHCPSAYITHSVARDLVILSGVERWFDHLASNKSFALELMTPDRTRRILDSDGKWRGLVHLSIELTALAKDVERELSGPFYLQPPDRETLRKRLDESKIPIIPEGVL